MRYRTRVWAIWGAEGRDSFVGAAPVMVKYSTARRNKPIDGINAGWGPYVSGAWGRKVQRKYVHLFNNRKGGAE